MDIPGMLFSSQKFNAAMSIAVKPLETNSLNEMCSNELPPLFLGWQL